jgi:hypothetical protein
VARANVLAARIRERGGTAVLFEPSVAEAKGIMVRALCCIKFAAFLIVMFTSPLRHSCKAHFRPLPMAAALKGATHLVLESSEPARAELLEALRPTQAGRTATINDSWTGSYQCACIPQGMRVVSAEWVSKSLGEGRLLPEEPYELTRRKAPPPRAKTDQPPASHDEKGEQRWVLMYCERLTGPRMCSS